MTKKEYLKPTMLVFMTDMNQPILTNSVTSVKTNGLGDDKLGLGGEGDSWDEGMSRRQRNVWDEEEEEE